MVEWSQRLLTSYRHWTGRELIERIGDSSSQARILFEAPFVVVSHGMEPDPILNYGNQVALDLWEMPWEQLIRTPSKLTAQPDDRTERERMLGLAKQGQVVETILAEQVILEGVGEALLTRIEVGLLKRAAPFRPLRQILLLQEEAHAGFGRRYLDRAIASGRTSTDALRADAQEYLQLAMAMVTTLGDLFGDLQEDATAWASDISHFVPAWLQSEASPQTPRTVAP